MARIYPYQALMPPADKAQEIASLPYDVMNRAEAAAMAEGNPLSFLRVTRADLELPEEVDTHSDRAYAKAKLNLGKLRKQAPMVVDNAPSLYIYGMTWRGQTQYGVACAASVDDYDNDVIKRHEDTKPDKVYDRTRHIWDLRAHTGQVLLTCLPTDTLDALLRDSISEAPLFEVTSNDVNHVIWRVPETLTQPLVDEFAEMPALYVADGHHRAASASAVREHWREQQPDATGEEGYNRFPVVIVPADQMTILPYNRVVKGMNGLSKSAFLEALEEVFMVGRTSEMAPGARGRIHFYMRWQWYELWPRFEVGGKLDVSILQELVLNPLLGIEDPRTDPRIDFVGGIRGPEELVKLVDSEAFDVGFSMYPTAIEQLLTVADRGGRMPPKSTWFEPKLLDGLLVHTF